MPLDNAEFIAELDIDSPLGTDPLNQGDDQIRTTKKAVQQSLPLLDAAVNITSAQMNQMAIKNEANTFTQICTFQQPPTFENDINLDSGSTSAVSYLKSGVRQWQLLYSGTSENWDVRRYTGGVLQDAPLEIIRSTGVVNMLRGATFGATSLFADGSAAVPSIAFSGQTDTGIYRPGTSIGFTVGGSDVAFMLGTQMRYVDGINAAPAYSFINQINSGMWRGSSTQLNFSTDGVHGLTLSTIQLQSLHDGIETFPAYAFASFPGSGMLVQTGGVVAFATDGTVAMSMRGTGNAGIFAGVGVAFQADGNLTAATFPGYTFSNDADSGFYRAAANSVSVSVGGVTALNYDFSTLAIWTGAGFAIRGDPARVAAQPAYAFTNDTDTGMFRRATNALGFAVGGVEIFNIGGGGIGVIAGKLCFFNLPTSPSTGGSLWNDGGTVKVA